MDLRGIVRAALLIAAAVAAGCSKKAAPESVSTAPDTVAVAVDTQAVAINTLPITYGTLIDPRDGQKYRSVVIGGRTWMAQNLNYETPDSSWCYENSVDSCAKYGRLYAWNAAMSACPAGWRLPSRKDLRNLDDSAGGFLKAASGWNRDFPYYADEDKDLHGFSAVPGGGRSCDDGRFFNAGEECYLWSSTERGNGRATYYLRIHEVDKEEALSYKSNGKSVRCVLNDSNSTAEKSDAEKIEEARRLAKKNTSYFTDERDGRKYRAVKIGDRTWMAENLNYHPPKGNTWCYENKDSYCDKYGRLYDLAAAISACPAGWHLPSRDEWANMAETAGGDMGRTWRNRDDSMVWLEAGLRLKSGPGWKGDDDDGATDEFGFSALPGGNRDDQGYFNNVGENGYWWEIGTDEDECYDFSVEMDYYGDNVCERQSESSYGYSVRCVQDGSGAAEEQRKKAYKKRDADLKRWEARKKKSVFPSVASPMPNDVSLP